MWLHQLPAQTNVFVNGGANGSIDLTVSGGVLHILSLGVIQQQLQIYRINLPGTST